MAEEYLQRAIDVRDGEHCMADILGYMKNQYKTKSKSKTMDDDLLSIKIMLRVSLYNDSLVRKIHPFGVTKTWELLHAIGKLDIRSDQLAYIRDLKLTKKGGANKAVW